MPEEVLTQQLISLEEDQSCFLTLTDKNGHEFRCEGHFLHANESHFSISLPEEDNSEWDTNVSCSFSTAPVLGRTTVSCKAKISKHFANIIELVATENFDPASLRNYFRVNLRVPIILADAPTLEGGDDSKWLIKGQTVDISRSGALAIFEEECPQNQKLIVTLQLPDPASVVSCKARMIRIKRLTKKRWLTALHFDQSDIDKCDIITANCLQEQRRQIRENVSID